MKQTSYKDEQGRWWTVMLPDGVPDSDASMGIPLGPPSLSPLGLPLEVEVRLHNQLFSRRLFDLREAKKRKLDIQGAIQAALSVDVEKILLLYRTGGEGNGRKVVSPTPVVRTARKRR